MASTDLEVVTFDDEQIFAVGRALMAVADQVYEGPKIEPITYEQDDVIELLSDSENADENENMDDDDSDCEIFGQICANVEEAQENASLEPQIVGEPAISSTFIETDVQNVANSTGDAVENIADQAVIASDATINTSICYKITRIKSPSAQGITHEIIELDDDDDDDDDDNDNDNDYNEQSNNDDGNADYSDEDVKEKKCVDLLEVNSDDDNQPSTSRRNCNSHNLEAFLNYLCPQCGVTCGTLKNWNAHTDIVHNFRSISTLNFKTVITREGVLCYSCNSCETRFKSDRSFGILLKHRIKHMPIPSFLRCRLCEARFSDRRLFLLHFKKNHKKIVLQKLGRTESIRRHVNFVCPICKEKANSYGDWVEHLDEEHEWYEKLTEKITTIRDTLVECNTCNATFRIRQAKWHMLRHEDHKPFHCKFCTFNVYDLNIIARHIRLEHLNEPAREYLCHYCDKVLPTASRRNAHAVEMHTIERLTCDVCHKKFNSSARLFAHMAKMNHQKMK